MQVLLSFESCDGIVDWPCAPTAMTTLNTAPTIMTRRNIPFLHSRSAVIYACTCKREFRPSQSPRRFRRAFVSLAASELACQPRNNTGKLLLAHATQRFSCDKALEHSPLLCSEPRASGRAVSTDPGRLQHSRNRYTKTESALVHRTILCATKARNRHSKIGASSPSVGFSLVWELRLYEEG